MAGLIYKIQNQVNGKVYIGQTTQPLSYRQSEHLYRLRANERQHKLYQAMRKYGEENFKFSEYAYAIDESDLNDLEIEIIKDHNSFNRGYNSTAGGDSVSEETKRLLSEKFKGRPMTWAHKVVETKRKNDTFPKKGYGGYGADHKASKRFLVRDPEGNEIEFTGLRQFCRDRNLSHNLLIATLNKTQSHHKGYVLLKRFND